MRDPCNLGCKPFDMCFLALENILRYFEKSAEALGKNCSEGYIPNKGNAQFLTLILLIC